MCSQLATQHSATGSFPKVSDVQEFLRTLPVSGEAVPDFASSLSPGPLECNLKTLKGHLTRLRKEITQSTSSDAAPKTKTQPKQPKPAGATVKPKAKPKVKTVSLLA